MSWANPRAITWARQQVTGHRTCKLVLLALASYCGPDDGCQVRVEDLARDCELDERSVQRSLRALADFELIEIRERSQEGRSRPNEYRLTMAAGQGGGLPPRGDKSSAFTPAANANRGGAGATPTAIKATAIIKASSNPPTATARESGEVLLFSASVPHAFSIAAVEALALLPVEQRQLVADEWMARLHRRKARNGLDDLRALIESAQAGRFVPEFATEEASRRTAALAAQSAGDVSATSANRSSPEVATSDDHTVAIANHSDAADETKRIGQRVAKRFRVS